MGLIKFREDDGVNSPCKLGREVEKLKHIKLEAMQLTDDQKQIRTFRVSARE